MLTPACSRTGTVSSDTFWRPFVCKTAAIVFDKCFRIKYGLPDLPDQLVSNWVQLRSTDNDSVLSVVFVITFPFKCLF